MLCRTRHTSESCGTVMLSTARYLSFHPMAQCVAHAFKGLACRTRVTPASSPASHCKQRSAAPSAFRVRADKQTQLANRASLIMYISKDITHLLSHLGRRAYLQRRIARPKRVDGAVAACARARPAHTCTFKRVVHMHMKIICVRRRGIHAYPARAENVQRVQTSAVCDDSG